MAQPAELLESLVPDAGRLEAAGQLVFAVLGVVARLGDGAHIHEGANAVRVQDADELVDRVGRVAHRENRGHLRTLRRPWRDIHLSAEVVRSDHGRQVRLTNMGS